MTGQAARTPMVSPALVWRGIDAAAAVPRRIPLALVLLLARLSIASVFWTSGRTKVDSGTWLSLSDNAVMLFRDEYGISLGTPTIAAEVAMVSEHLFPLLLVVGLGSRLAAAALLTMTLVIEIFVYPDAYNVHGPWAVCLLLILREGGGRLSLDFWIGRKREANVEATLGHP